MSEPGQPLPDTRSRPWPHSAPQDTEHLPPLGGLGLPHGLPRGVETENQYTGIEPHGLPPRGGHITGGLLPAPLAPLSHSPGHRSHMPTDTPVCLSPVLSVVAAAAGVQSSSPHKQRSSVQVWAETPGTWPSALRAPVQTSRPSFTCSGTS